MNVWIVGSWSSPKTAVIDVETNAIDDADKELGYIWWLSKPYQLPCEGEFSLLLRVYANNF